MTWEGQFTDALPSMEAVATAVTWLASDEVSFLKGEAVDADRGALSQSPLGFSLAHDRESITSL